MTTKATIITTAESGEAYDMTRKVTDLAKPGNRKWLLSHIRWALAANQTVTIQPSH